LAGSLSTFPFGLREKDREAINLQNLRSLWFQSIIRGVAWRQPLPYLTSDNRHVVYSADPDGILNVYAAQIPYGFLESLE